MLLLTLAVAALAGEWPSIDEVLRTGAEAHADAAVVIGIENYPFLTSVPHAQRDAEAFRNYLVYTRGTPLRSVHVLIGASAEQMRSEVQAAASEVGDGGILWIYFAGHGGGDPQTSERLLIGDTAKQDAASFRAGAVPVSELEGMALASGQDVVFITDACYNGLGRDGAQHGKQRFAVPSYALDGVPKLTRWFAAGPSELANPLEPVSHGAFTYFAIGALRGWADGELGESDGQVTLDEADAYVTRSLAEVGKREQHPQLDDGGPGVLSRGKNLESGPDLRALVSELAAPSRRDPGSPSFVVDVDVDAALKEKGCREQGEATAVRRQKERLADGVAAQATLAVQTWVGLEEQSRKCAQLDTATRIKCGEKVSEFIEWANALQVVEAASFETVGTDCGDLQIPVAATASAVAVSSVAEARTLLSILQADPPGNSVAVFPDGRLTVDFLDVGEGDAILIHSPLGKNILIDGGPSNSEVVAHLAARGVQSLELVVATHPHAGSIGGLHSVVDSLDVELFVDNGVSHTSRTYKTLREAVHRGGTAYRAVKKGTSLPLDSGIALEVLHPGDQLLTGTRSDLNSNSVVLRMTYGSACFLFVGDAETPTEKQMIENGVDSCDVLKVAHAGGKYSTSKAWLEAINPKLAVVSVGTGNRYGHPSPEALDRLQSAGAAIHRTDLHGSVRLETDGKQIIVSPDSGRGAVVDAR